MGVGDTGIMIVDSIRDYDRNSLPTGPYWVKELNFTSHNKEIVQLTIYLRRTLHPVIVTIRVTSNYIRVLLYSYHTTTTGWGIHLMYTLIRMLFPNTPRTEPPRTHNFQKHPCEL